MVLGGYLRMGRAMIVASRASCQRILITISSRMSETIYSSSSQHTNPFVLQGDIFALQLRGHFAFA
jgi:hypothetical protein